MQYYNYYYTIALKTEKHNIFTMQWKSDSLHHIKASSFPGYRESHWGHTKVMRQKECYQLIDK